MNRFENAAQKISRAVIENRKEISLWGIENVVSFDENFVVLDSFDTVITLDGSGLQIVKMDVDSGEITVTGQINGLVYSDKKSKTRKSFGLFGQGKRQ